MEEINNNVNSQNNIKKKSNVLGIISLILGILSILTSFVIFVAIPFGVAALITGIIALFKNKTKAMPIIGIILSVLAIVVSIIVTIVVRNVVNDVKESTKEFVDSDIVKDLKESITSLYNELSEDMTYELDNTDGADKLKGYSWKMGDGSLLVLNNDGTYYWYKDANDKTDNYYYGKYSTYLGDKAVEKFSENFQFNEEEYKKNTQILRNDIYYLKLDKEGTVISGKKSIVSQTTHYALFFYNASSNLAVGMNLGTQSTVSLKKVK